MSDEFIATEELRWYTPNKYSSKPFTLQQKWISVLDHKKVEWRDVPTVSENE